MAIIKGTSAADILNGSDGRDKIIAYGGDDTIYGNGGGDVIDGGNGNDTMLGGAGNDKYWVRDAGDLVFETTTTTSSVDAGGIDKVLSYISFSIDGGAGRQFIEHIALQGSANIDATGNALANKLIGNVGDNVLSGGAGNDYLKAIAGNDTLDGGTGADKMLGGSGNDTYIVDDAGDQVFETKGAYKTADAGGTDIVMSSVSYSIASNINGRQHIENMTLTGSGNINATGNDLANVLTGNAGNNVLDGGAGIDTLIGGLGNDTYVIDNAGDVITENAGGGIDTVQVGFAYTLNDANLENLTLTGSAAINGTGNALGNVLTGNAGANVLAGLDGDDTLIGGDGNDTIIGGKGKDSMSGGLGNDVFKFASALDTWAWSDFAGATASTAEVITDFTAGDKIDLSGVDAISSPSGHNVSGDQSFVFIGTNNFHKHTGREIRYEIYNGNTYVYGNINGDTTSDFSLKLEGVHNLTSSDFIL